MNTVKGCSVIDLFCGVGGLSHGFKLEGFKVLAGVDTDKACKYPYENNNGASFIDTPVEELDPQELRNYYPHNHKKILIGCAPCQPFSPYTKKKRDTTTKWKLLDTFADLIEDIRPHIVSMENVPELFTFKRGELYKKFVGRLEQNGYYVTANIVFCPDYGIPQSRERLVLLASKYNQIKLIEPTHSPDKYVSVRQAIGHLPEIVAGGTCPTDELHRCANLSPLNLSRIRASLPGGTWRDWPEELVAECHKKESGRSYDCVYGRMRWNDLAPTMTTQCNGYGNGRFGHPEQNRAISIREAAIFQSFPRDYQFFETGQEWHVGTMARLIGNAVPVKLGQVIARSIKRHIGK